MYYLMWVLNTKEALRFVSIKLHIIISVIYDVNTVHRSAAENDLQEFNGGKTRSSAQWTISCLHFENYLYKFHTIPHAVRSHFQNTCCK